MINITKDQMESLNDITENLDTKPETIELKFNNKNNFIVAKFNFKEVTGFTYVIDKDCNMEICYSDMYNNCDDYEMRKILGTKTKDKNIDKLQTQEIDKVVETIKTNKEWKKDIAVKDFILKCSKLKESFLTRLEKLLIDSKEKEKNKVKIKDKFMRIPIKYRVKVLNEFKRIIISTFRDLFIAIEEGDWHFVGTICFLWVNDIDPALKSLEERDYRLNTWLERRLEWIFGADEEW